jgi:hypothetical protein
MLSLLLPTDYAHMQGKLFVKKVNKENRAVVPAQGIAHSRGFPQEELRGTSKM